MADPLTVEAIGILLTALGLSSASGLRAYFPLLALGLGSNFQVGEGEQLITLSEPFQALGTWWFVGLLAVLVVGEFAVDKVPILDHISDALHTIVRPVSGAIIMAGISNPLSEENIWAAALVGAALSLTIHSAKTVSRPAVTASTAGIGNPMVSLAEDVIVAVITVAALLAPLVAFALLVTLAVVVALLVRAGWRKLRPRNGAPPSGTTLAGPPRGGQA